MVHRLYIEAAVPIERELYIGLVLDRKSERIMVVASPQGGMEIEEIAQSSPDTILREVVEPAVGMTAFQARELAFGLGLGPAQVSRAVTTLLGAYRAFRDLDATMVEINPLVVTKDGALLALDAKMTFDDNALFRRPNVARAARLRGGGSARGRRRREHGLNYVALDGNIGCIINGAGLAMATMDMIKHAGGEPANFLDVGGGASPGTGGRGVPPGAGRPQDRGDAGEHLRRHQPLRLGGAGRGAGHPGDPAQDPARGAARRHERRGGAARS